MKLRSRVWIIVAIALLGLVAMSVNSLYQLRQNLLKERRAQIAQLLDFADAQLRYFYGLEISGKLTREEAQSRAREAIAAQKKGSDYFFIRTLTDDLLVYHPVPSRMGKADPGELMSDGRMNAAAYREDLKNSKDNKAFLTVYAARPNSSDTKSYPKLVGVLKFEPWGWMPGIGFYVDDIERIFWHEAMKMLAFVGVLILIVFSLATFMIYSVINLLGCEPKYAAECMRKIADGDLGVEVKQENGKEDSMIASLKIMQMKLKNIYLSIHENAGQLEKHAEAFDVKSKSYAASRAEADLVDLQKSARKILDTSNVFRKSMGRIKV